MDFCCWLLVVKNVVDRDQWFADRRTQARRTDHSTLRLRPSYLSKSYTKFQIPRRSYTSLGVV
jgi:hypothetical protein